MVPYDWTTTANVIRETGKRVLGVSSGRKTNKETWWWNEEVQKYAQKKRLARKSATLRGLKRTDRSTGRFSVK